MEVRKKTCFINSGNDKQYRLMYFMNKESQIEIALSLLDFCGGNLSIEQSNKFFQMNRFEYDLTTEQERQIFLTAYSLIK